MITDFPSEPLFYPNHVTKKTTLAIMGGDPVIEKEKRKTIFPNITKEDCYQLIAAIHSSDREKNEVAQFSEEYRRYVGASYALPTASGTSGLHLALAGVGVKEGDEVIVPAFTFIATAMAVLQAKAIPRFADVDPDTFTLCPKDARRVINDRVSAIMPVHTHGLPADVASIQSLCTQKGLKFVEDASHAHSATVSGVRCGALGDSAGQSLMADKNFPVGGEGGIAFFKHEGDYIRAKKYIEKNGLDYHMSWVAASFGRSQLRRLPYYDKIRRRNSAFLSEQLNKLPGFSAPHVPAGHVHSYNMYRFHINRDEFDVPDDVSTNQLRMAVQKVLNAEGVPVRGWQNCPLPFHPAFSERFGFGNGFPWSHSLSDDHQYSLEQFPNTLAMLESTLVICRELRSPVEVERVHCYVAAFEKLVEHRDDLIQIARTMEDKLPWEQIAQLG